MKYVTYERLAVTMERGRLRKVRAQWIWIALAACATLTVFMWTTSRVIEWALT